MATELIDRAIEALGAGIASAVDLLDVSNVVIGAVSAPGLGEPYVERIREAMQPHLFVDENPPTVASVALRRPRRRDGRRPAGAGRRRRSASPVTSSGRSVSAGVNSRASSMLASYRSIRAPSRARA